ncbi:Bgt-3649 [Blumeria graminis f. sp. tritici]|uniref:Bgt-3649 n=2 Tax=Blumeria graminis f. sp. tritici TaxID=62690 RepID=A0A061HHG6_BLUGR|nr:hypothetical protein BGT96224_3649 [Blumeria graminis f. sp. tritici 96224]VDB93755.1 Bgt-3649 [Blumeria graminis f. sp. tritici]
MPSSAEDTTNHLVIHLRRILADLVKQSHQSVVSTDGYTRRASVALIVRIRPHFDHWPTKDDIDECNSSSLDQDTFFTRDWVLRGDPEVAFIKRASRDGDRWTSHVALPGGKREAGDKDDKAVAMRETLEEIGLDISSNNALFCGNLPERIVKTAWGTFPIMILCPFVFLWLSPDIPPLKLQPEEVASIHWVPIRVLLSPSSQSYEYVDISDRLAKRRGPLVKSTIRSMLGSMRFSAIRLLPSESLYCTSKRDFSMVNEVESTEKTWPGLGIQAIYFSGPNDTLKSTKPLLLWGLTLGILIDFLDYFPPHNAINLWRYPTFTAYDVQWIINIMSSALKQRNRALLLSQKSYQQSISEGILYMGEISELSVTEGNCSTEIISSGKADGKPLDAVGIMLEGYYQKVRQGAIFTIFLRLLGTTTMLYFAKKRWRHKL